jgi:Mob1/phocein family
MYWKAHIECCAMDYMIHNLDQSASYLTNTKNYPSRVSIPQTGVANLKNFVRRLYRLFSHTYFHH